MGYKRMTRARVKLMQAIPRDHKLPPISLGGEQQQVTTRLTITDEEAHNTSTIQKARQQWKAYDGQTKPPEPPTLQEINTHNYPSLCHARKLWMDHIAQTYGKLRSK